MSVRVLAFSDLHLDGPAADRILRAAQDADLVIGAGDFAQRREGLTDYVARLAPLEEKAILVPGNNENLAELEAATTATILHGDTVTRRGLTIAGIGGGIPPLPPMASTSWDLTEDEATACLVKIEHADILISHSPPKGFGDAHGDLGQIGSTAIRAAMTRLAPALCVFGHVHDDWGAMGRTGRTTWRNLGPEPVWFDLVTEAGVVKARPRP